MNISKLILVGINASQSGEDYWKTIWPNTPMPKALSDLLQPESTSNLPIRGEENKQYWTIFFEHDLYPGNKISLGFNKSNDKSQPLGAVKWDKNEIQPFGSLTWLKKTSEERNQPFGVAAWWLQKTSEERNQPFGFRAWRWNEKPSQPFEAHTWGGKERQSFDNYCIRPSAIGEEKYCALSLKSMMNFAISKLGTNIKVISSSFAQNQDQYKVDEVKKIGDKAVMCHRLNFKDMVFYCHQVNATTVYMVLLVASDGTKAKALTICHHDTRGMNPDVLYELLKVKPGTIPICHFVGNKAIAWVPDSS
ncbi:putative BURP domain-containing protein [Medicago truncatula]|uniref:Embryonic abundant-like protein n=1 Tax=Medicago truncatula TaxID=3880 RepID=A0A072TQU4_MEDTR|nr:embryonic abundant-like protein [Medicago truncatula]RHN40495.1 putative BURP domain-containing protein [Medicago truncatula]